MLLFNTLLFIALTELAATAALSIVRAVRPPVDPRSQRPYYAEQPWAETYWREFGQRATLHDYVPYVGWRHRPFPGEQLHIDESGLRRTPGARCENGAFELLAFGGSTMWGTGSHDRGTIAAQLQKALGERWQRPVCVVNHGQGAYVSTQSLIELETQIRLGNIPDLVIFYDGVNDIFASYQSGLPGVHQNLEQIAALVEQRQGWLGRLASRSSTIDLLSRLLGRAGLSSSRPPVDFETLGVDGEQLAREIIRAYAANYRMVSLLAERYGFDFAFFWQPVIVAGAKTLTQWEQEIVAQQPPARNRLYRLTYPLAEQLTRQHDRMFFIADVFDGVTEELWIDNVHVTPPGNVMVADAMLAAIEWDETCCSRASGATLATSVQQTPDAGNRLE